MAKEKITEEPEVMTTGTSEEPTVDEEINDVGADTPVVEPPAEEPVVEEPSVEETVDAVVKQRREVTLVELTRFVRFLAARSLGPAELAGAQASFPHIFED